MARHVDVVIAGAGISGIAAGHYLKRMCPQKTFAIFEARDAIGGTWDLFRYPGIRSDSDMYTFGYSFRPWNQPQVVAPGPDILEYLNATVDESGIRPSMEFGRKIERASFSKDTSLWTVQVRHLATNEVEAMTCRVLWSCMGYYRYDEGYTPAFDNLSGFGGRVIHPQHWPEDLDYAGKKIVVIGSGATAITLVPALAESAAHVTMLQRSPSYVVAVPRRNALDSLLVRWLGERRAYPWIRWKHISTSILLYKFTRYFPKLARRLLVGGARKALPPGFDVDRHFQPEYNPWDQRLCMAPDGDFFSAIDSGKASVVTDTIARFTERGIALNSGPELEADIVVTATGLNVRLFGGVPLDIDGAPVEVSKTFGYKGAMLSGVPNFAYTLGYINASWTLRAELTSQYVCRVLKTMDDKGLLQFCPQTDVDVPLDAPTDLTSGYFKRAADRLPKRGRDHPWRAEQNFKVDRRATLASIEDGILEFSVVASAKEPERTPLATAAAS